MTHRLKTGFGTAIFIAFSAVFTWAGGFDDGWRGLLVLIAGAPLSILAANAILKHEKEFPGQ
jgi:hypothetical protein